MARACRLRTSWSGRATRAARLRRSPTSCTADAGETEEPATQSTKESAVKAVGYRTKGDAGVLVNLELPTPDPGPRDLLVEVRAVSVNPVDVKRRRWEDPDERSGHRVLGYDASGIVVAVGREVTLFKPGDEVFYAGAMDRPGTNSQLHLVDERVVGPKPTSLSFAEAAAMPLTTITAWEMLFDRMKLPL